MHESDWSRGPELSLGACLPLAYWPSVCYQSSWRTVIARA